MLGAINQGRVPGCEWRQADIVHFETTVDRVVADGGRFVFYDSNATLGWSDPYNDLARLDLAELLVDEKRVDEAESLLNEVQDNAELDARRDALRAAAGFARGGGDQKEAEARVAAKPDDLEARYALAQLHAAARRYREAMEELLAIVRRDKNWRDGEARRQLVNLFTLAGDEPDLVSEYRRKLATALY